MIVAKPVIKGQFWILQQDEQKIGNVEAVGGGGYQVRIKDSIAQFKTMKMLESRLPIQFMPAVNVKTQNRILVHGYQAAGRAYNDIWNVKYKLPLYTKTRKSKSWFAAGWYRVRRGSTWQVVRDPKLITLQRYEYAGPFHTDQEATP
jgi:hypothetical protein